jgi:hypothetical protein
LIPRRLIQIAWFLGLWAAGVSTVAAAALLIKAVLG